MQLMEIKLIVFSLVAFEGIITIAIIIFNIKVFGTIKFLYLLIPYSELKLYSMNVPQTYVQKVLRYNTWLKIYLITTAIIYAFIIAINLLF
jgi:hypothetical protein